MTVPEYILRKPGKVQQESLDIDLQESLDIDFWIIVDIPPPPPVSNLTWTNYLAGLLKENKAEDPTWNYGFQIQARFMDSIYLETNLPRLPHFHKWKGTKGIRIFNCPVEII